MSCRQGVASLASRTLFPGHLLHLGFEICLAAASCCWPQKENLALIWVSSCSGWSGSAGETVPGHRSDSQLVFFLRTRRTIRSSNLIISGGLVRAYSAASAVLDAAVAAALRPRGVGTGRGCGVTGVLENPLTASFLYKNTRKKLLTMLVPTRSLAWIALLDLSPGGDRDIGFGGVYHLWILHKICRRGGIVLPHLRAGRKTYCPSITCESHGAYGNSCAKLWQEWNTAARNM